MASADICGRWLLMLMEPYGSPLAVLSAASRMVPSASALQHSQPVLSCLLVPDIFPCEWSLSPLQASFEPTIPIGTLVPREK